MTDGQMNKTEASKQPKRGAGFKVLVTALALLVTVVLALTAAIGYYSKSVVDALDAMERDPQLMPTGSARPSPVPTKEGAADPPVNIVLMGSDTCGAERGRSDVLMVLHIPGDREHGYLISFPRDYWVQVPGRGYGKINAAYSWGGAPLTIATIESLLNVPMDHTALIDFEGFVEVIDALGGIEVYNRYASQIDNYYFEQGMIELDGESALKFVRNRYGLPEGDLDRAERQRDVLIAIIDKLTSRGVLANPAKFREALAELGPNFTVDDEFTTQAMLDLGLSMRISGGEDIRSMQAPVAGTGTSNDGQAILRPNMWQLARLGEAMRADDLETYWQDVNN